MQWQSLLVLGAFLTVAGDTPKTGGAAEDERRLQGTWGYVAREVDGKTTPPEAFKDWTVTFEAGKVEYAPPAPGPTTYKLETARKPKTIDIVMKHPITGADVPHYGIYQLEGEQLKLCLTVPYATAAARPTEFKSSGQLILVTLKREKR